MDVITAVMIRARDHALFITPVETDAGTWLYGYLNVLTRRNFSKNPTWWSRALFVDAAASAPSNGLKISFRRETCK